MLRAPVSANRHKEHILSSFRCKTQLLNKMETIKVYSAFSHKFSCSKDDTDIHYYESKYVKAPDNHVICIDSAEKRGFDSKIGEKFQPGYMIELWATKTFEERIKQDFINLRMKRQIIHYCDGTTKIIEVEDLQLV
jgi:hypothetical protein